MLSESSERSRSKLRKQREFREVKKLVDGFSKNIIHSIVKLEEMGSHLGSMHQKLQAARAREA